MTMKRLILSVALIAIGAALPGAVWAQKYPVKSVRLLVGFPPGGGTDLIARLVAQKLTAALGQPVVVENRPGASANIAAEIAAKAAPDGYTLLFGNSSLSISPAVFSKLNYDPVKDLVPISMASSYPFVLVAHPSLPVRNVRELVALAKARPGELDYASAGAGTMSHLAMELLRLRTGIKVGHLPYKGAAPVLVAVLAGEAPAAFIVVPVAGPQVKAGKLRGLGVASPTRSAVIPDTPTMTEAGIQGHEAVQWNGLFAPARTPQAILDLLHAEMAKAVTSPELRQRFDAEGAVAVGNSPAEFGAYFRAEAEKWADVAKRSGTRLD
ncbi:MAG: tripartite tricarboxylate transporter substrate binding protein [Betaproteobacteria bacterium]|nr:tripartite tricarboxylate transporter substrate binding protein [Betaproteobacteria bacterium]